MQTETLCGVIANAPGGFTIPAIVALSLSLCTCKGSGVCEREQKVGSLRWSIILRSRRLQMDMDQSWWLWKWTASLARVFRGQQGGFKKEPGKEMAATAKPFFFFFTLM
jgi:hypothetical protein